MYLQSDDYFPFGQACEEVGHVGVGRWSDIIMAQGISPGGIKPTGDDHQLWIILGVWCVGVWGCEGVWECEVRCVVCMHAVW